MSNLEFFFYLSCTQSSNADGAVLLVLSGHDSLLMLNESYRNNLKSFNEVLANNKREKAVVLVSSFFALME